MTPITPAAHAFGKFTSVTLHRSSLEIFRTKSMRARICSLTASRFTNPLLGRIHSNTVLLINSKFCAASKMMQYRASRWLARLQVR